MYLNNKIKYNDIINFIFTNMPKKQSPNVKLFLVTSFHTNKIKVNMKLISYIFNFFYFNF